MTTLKIQISGKMLRWSCIFFFLCLLQPLAGYSSSAVTVAVLPLDSMEASQLGALDEGVRGMLISRMSAEEGMELLPAAYVDRVLHEVKNGWSPDEVAPLFESLDADYLLLPVLRSDGFGWTLQVQLFNPFTAGHAAHTFESTGTATGQVVASVSRLTREIGVFITDLEEKSAVEDQVGQSAVAIKSEDLVSFRTAHPERSNPEIIALAGAFRINKPVFDSELSLFITALESGDIDADGKDEVVLLGESYLVVKRQEGKEVRQIAVFPLPAGVNTHGVGIADLNGNGIAEIYVSGMRDNLPSSFIIEWTPRGFVLLASSIPWYIRVVDIPGEGLVLAGQRFDGENAAVVSRLFWQKNSLSASSQINLPRQVNLFGFTKADLDGDGKNETISITSEGQLQVHNSQNRQLWQSENYFCGTYRTIAGTKKEDALNPFFAPDHEMLTVPSRIVVTDFNRDGQNDVVVNKNPMTMGRIFEDGKSYPQGIIIGFIWNGEKLREAWRTKPFGGYVVEYQMRQGDSQEAEGQSGLSSDYLQLIVGMRQQQTGIFDSGYGKSRLYLFEMDLGWL